MRRSFSAFCIRGDDGAVAAGYAQFASRSIFASARRSCAWSRRPAAVSSGCLARSIRRKTASRCATCSRSTRLAAPIAQFAPRFLFVEFPSRYEEVAGFGSATLRLTERFDVTAGVRWARNRQRFRQISGGLESADRSARGRHRQFRRGRVDLQREPALAGECRHDALRARGDRLSPRRPEPRALDLPPTVVADTLTNYELGLKSQISRQVARCQCRGVPHRLAGHSTGRGRRRHRQRRQHRQCRKQGASSSNRVLARRSSAHRRQRGVHGCAADIARRGHRRGPARQHAALECIRRCSTTNWRSPIAGPGTSAVAGDTWASRARRSPRRPGADNSYVLPSLRRARPRRRAHARQLDDPALRPQRYGSARLHRRRPGVDADDVPYGIDASVLQPRTVGISVDVGF